MTDLKPITIIDGDCVSVGLVVQVDVDPRWIAGRLVKEFIIDIVQTGTINPPPSLDFFKPVDQRVQWVSNLGTRMLVWHWQLT